ncbi:MAG: glycoside hydrolase family 127 protein [Oscillospiraceae bacterium]|nr:glycoside hydrolase family 127 protein [Oscillospiraceae bacterium]
MANFKINDKFWTNYQNIVSEVMLPYQYEILSDSLDDEDLEKSHALRNFKIAAGEEKGEFYGMVFQDSDVAKWLEAVAYSLAINPSKELETKADEVIELIGRAQMEDGYINTFYQINSPDKRWQNLQEDHELYCAGHLIEAGVAYFEATGKTKLLETVKRFADYIDSVFGETKREGIPGHPEIELALIRLYNVTDDKKYLNLANYFINQRGKNRRFYIEESEKRGGTTTFGMDPKNTDYSQATNPVREEKNAIGHAVRATYLYTAMAMSAGNSGEEELTQACKCMWDSMIDRQMYITGGIGSSFHGGECFTADYDLPNDTAYNETCASIALIFFAKEMLKITNEAKYADIMERALYNNTLSGMNLAGNRFLYANPLDFDPKLAETVPIQSHIKKERPKWYTCACCPPNLARLIASLDRYTWHETKDILYSDLFIGGIYESEKMKVEIITDYPYYNSVSYKIHNADRISKLALRFPQWSENTALKQNGKEISPTMESGYAVIDIKNGDEIELTPDITPKKVYSNYNINGNLGKCAIMAGPLIYCFEEIDNGENLNALQIDAAATPKSVDFEDGKLSKIKAVKISGKCLKQSDGLYSLAPPSSQPVELTAIPYYAWGNRGKCRMKVWLVER